MSSRKSFTGTPYSRPPSTPRQQQERQDGNTPGSILRTIFSPAKWFTQKPALREHGSDDDAHDDDDDDDEKGREEDEQTEEPSDGTASSGDEEARIGSDYHTTPMTQAQVPNTSKSAPNDDPHTPDSSMSKSNPDSPNSVLAAFFNSKGNAPLTPIELEGVKALLARQSQPGSYSEPQGHAPSYVTPTRRPYQPIFTPAHMLPITRAATEVKKVRRGYVPSTTVASPFQRRNPARTGFATTTRLPHPAQFSTPAKYELRTNIPANATALENGKRYLEELAAPAAKRVKSDSTDNTQPATGQSTSASTGSKTAASILEILEDDSSIEDSASSKPADTPRKVLNPYSSSNSARKFAKNVASSAKKVPEDPARPSAERKIPYQPKKSSGLLNSFSAADEEDTSLFSPRRRIASPAVQRRERIVDTQTEATPTKTALPSNSSSAIEKPAFTASTITTHSTTPGFSFNASQMSSKSSFTTVRDDPTSSDPAVGQATSQDPGSALHQDNGKSDVAEHKAHGGFTFGQSTTENPAFTFGAAQPASETSEHKAHGGFVFNAGPVEPATEIHPNAGEAKHDDIVVHQLRDGTEYVSPSKAKSKPTSSQEETKSTATGFVFNPSHSSSSSFSFTNYKKPTSSSSGSGFVFDPTKPSAPNKTEIPASSSERSEISKSKDVPPETDEQRASAVSEHDLQPYKYTVCRKVVYSETQKQVLAAELLQVTFSSKSTKNAPTAPKSGGFDWAAAGLKKPEGGWSCDVCMVNNKADASQCVSCESKRPVTASTITASEADTDVSQAAPASKGGFDWAAAGMKVPAQQWSCSVCMTSNPDSAKACLACEADR